MWGRNIFNRGPSFFTPRPTLHDLTDPTTDYHKFKGNLLCTGGFEIAYQYRLSRQYASGMSDNK